MISALAACGRDVRLDQGLVVEDLHRRGRGADIDTLPEQSPRHRIQHLADLDGRQSGPTFAVDQVATPRT